MGFALYIHLHACPLVFRTYYVFEVMNACWVHTTRPYGANCNLLSVQVSYILYDLSRETKSIIVAMVCESRRTRTLLSQRVQGNTRYCSSINNQVPLWLAQTCATKSVLHMCMLVSLNRPGTRCHMCNYSGIRSRVCSHPVCGHAAG